MTLTREDEISLRIFANHRAEGFAHIDGPNKLAVSLSVLRRYQPRVFAHLIATDTECSGVSVQHRWLHEPQPWQRTPEEIAHAEQTVRETLDAIRSRGNR